MTSYVQLERELNALLESHDFTTEKVLSMVGVSTRNAFFGRNKESLHHMEQVASILFADIDGDGKLTVNDIKQTMKAVGSDLKDHFLSVRSLATDNDHKVGVRLLENVLLLIRTMDDKSINYDSTQMELLAFKTLIWAFLYEIPAKNNFRISKDVSRAILRLLILLFQYYQSIDAVRAVNSKIEKYINTKLSWCCPCLGKKKATVKPGATENATRKFQKAVVSARVSKKKDADLAEMRSKLASAEAELVTSKAEAQAAVASANAAAQAAAEATAQAATEAVTEAAAVVTEEKPAEEKPTEEVSAGEVVIVVQ